MHQHVGRKDGEIVDHHLAGNFCRVANDATVADVAVVPDVHAFHEEVVAADHRAPLGRGAAVDGHILADGVVVAYFGGGDFAAELEILRYCADHSTGENGVALADARAAEQRHGVHQAVVVAQLYIGIDVAKGANLAVFADFGFGMDKGQWRNHGRCGCEGD